MSYDKPYPRPWAPKDASGNTPTPISPTALDKIDKGITDAHAELDGRLSEAKLNATFAPDGTAGNISKSTAQGIALVQALIFGGN